MALTLIVSGLALLMPSASLTRSRGISCLITGEVDEEAMLAASTFPIKPPALIARAKEILEAGVGTKDGGACLAADFEFCAAVVGPLGREEYLKALGTFKLETAFPDLNPNYYGFRVDPFEPHRVWFTSRSTATHTGPLLGKPATGKKLTLPPQQFHLDFNEDGLLREIGFYVVDRRQGNTGGLGGAFGYFYGTGNPLPIPECQPYRKSKRFRLLNLLGRVGSRLAKKSAPKATDAISMGVPAACKFIEANPTVSFADKKAFLLSKGVSEFVIAEAACTAPDTSLVL